MNTYNCENCELRAECSPMYPCELSNKLEEARAELCKYKNAWEDLKDSVAILQLNFENAYHYSNPQIEEIECYINQFEEKFGLKL